MSFTASRMSKEQVRAYFNELAQDWEMQFYYVRTILAENDKVAALGECCWRHKKTGKIVHTPKLDLLRFQHERIAGFFEFFDTERAFRAAMGDGSDRAPDPEYTTCAAIFDTASNDCKANMRLLERLYKNWNDTKGRSVDEIMNILAPQISWGSLADGANGIAFTSRKLSRKEVGAYFQGLAEAFQMNFYTVDDFLGAGDYVLMSGVCSFTNKLTGRMFETAKADVWRFSNGQAEEFFEFYDTAAVVATTH